METRSPQWVAMHEVRKSIFSPLTTTEKRPSCGRRFSVMFMPAMTLMRVMTDASMARGSLRTVIMTPSLRMRIASPSSFGSKAMSAAPRSTASVRIELTSSTMGASTSVLAEMS
ncbi:hypothetical protein D3C86_1104980 [compost metagenome]